MPKPTSAQDPLASIYDEIGDIRKELQPFKAKIAREAALCKLVRATSVDWPASAERTLQGTRWDVVLGPRGNQTSVNIVKLLKLVKAKIFNTIVSCTVSALERNDIAPEIIVQVVETKQTGYRDLNTFEKKQTP